MDRRQAPITEEGWYVLHDFRTIEWDAWREAPQRTRDAALEDGREYFEAVTSVTESEGDSALYAVLGHEADLLALHLRPTTEALDRLARSFEQTELARFTERTDSFVSVTEASGYSERAREFLEGDLDEDSGLATYMRSRLQPAIPAVEHLSFYPMDKRRDPEYNWYDLPFEERAEHMDAHGTIGREYGGKVTQMITGAIGIDDWEWGVTLWAADLTDVKELLYEMRFDPSSSKYAEFGPFFVGRRMEPTDLGAHLAGEEVGTAWGEDTDAESIPAAPADATAHPNDESGQSPGETAGEAPHSGHPESKDDRQVHEEAGDHSPSSPDDESTDGDDHPDTGSRPDVDDANYATVDDLDARLFQLGLREGEDYEGGEYGLLFYSDADATDLAEEVAGLRENFEHYDRHVATLVRASGGRSAVASLWTAEEAAETAAGFLSDISGVNERYGGVLSGSDERDSDERSADRANAGDIRDELAAQNVYAGKPHGEDVYALVVYSTASVDGVAEDVENLRETFQTADEHVKTAIYTTGVGDVTATGADDPTAVVSLWSTESAAETASDVLTDLPGVVGQAKEAAGFGTMGMFYTVKPEYREEFVDTFETVGEKLATMDGHRGTALLVNREDENDMFIASNWDAREDAMAFFQSEDFRETVEWGRDVLADQPRHVFLT